MNIKRYLEIEKCHHASFLTRAELDEGWHFCPDWDWMLVGPEMQEFECCTCRGVRETIERNRKNK